MNFSNETNELFAALAKAQADLGKAKEDGRNPHFRSRYATLESVRDVVMPAFTAHGLSITQHPGLDGGNVTMTTVVGHSSGQYMMSTSAVPMGKKQDSHAYGSACTYLRRFSMAAIASAVTGEDDDGNAVSSRGPSQAARKAPARAKPQVKAKAPATPRPGPTTGHHDSWAGNRARFCADLSSMGFVYEDVAAWCEAHQRGRPSTWDSHRRGKLVEYLGDSGNALNVQAWVKMQAELEQAKGEVTNG
jgi:hypothetical protein